MNDSDIYPTDPQDAIELTDEIDDVEGHGVKEVVAGLGVATVLAGGAAGAMQLTSAPLSVHPSGGDVSITVADPIDTAASTAHSAFGTAQATTDAALQTSDQAIASGLSTVAAAPATADRAVHDTATAVSTAVANAKATVQQTKDWATGPVVDGAKADVHAVATAADNAVRYATDTADSATSTVTSTAATTVGNAGTTLRDVDRKIATILSVTTTTATNGVHTAVVTLKAATDGAGVQADTAGGWVLVKSGDLILAQVHMSGGTATATWTNAVTGHGSVSISYTGDNVFAASSRTIDL
jgi:hypothetical protein